MTDCIHNKPPKLCTSCLRDEVERLRQDAARLDWLAANLGKGGSAAFVYCVEEGVPIREAIDTWRGQCKT